MKTDSTENLVSADSEAGTSDAAANAYDSIADNIDYVLTATEKKFLLSAERGDCAGVRRYNDKRNSFIVIKFKGDMKIVFNLVF